MPRLFTGLEIPPDLAGELAMMRGGLSGARWIDTDNYHITLRFIGDIDMPTAREVATLLDDIRRQPFTVTLEGLSFFGGDKPRAIVAKVQPSGPLVELQAEQERLIRRLGIPPEPRKFTPHVTLARLRGAPGIAVADYLSYRGFLTRRFTADRFVLFSSRDSVGGGPYITEEVYPFG
ncbi:RNA 2',3'-cyclic phosphodiesterase [Lichenifustis flavocetrariae]|uniref:RNA 2',3'-cyclic phosphodiesterase n=1 Tax=Lichenifustis flavocetrariae TaxID=2949735 RepID=A0AA42CLN1_9HYPH|nr:RNA 2',3'-cyclic phosphodiesterase [Lichenifustis flavocetrariae]MCW6507547.1 RNA 2',3'-cyclic phosphodiesterase [Lichenifustis flavocetrariae]